MSPTPPPAPAGPVGPVGPAPPSAPSAVPDRVAVAVRPATEDDVPAIAGLFGAAFEDYRRGLGVDAPTLAALWRGSLAARIPATTVATLPEGTVAGFVITVRPGAKERYAQGRRAWGRPPRRREADWRRVLGLRRLWRPPALFIPMGLAYARRRQAGDELYVSLIAVDPQLQGRGIGQALLRAAEDEARAAGAAAVLLHTAATNTRARAAYARAGYELVCTVRAVWPGPAGIPAYVALRRPLRPDPAPRIAALTRSNPGGPPGGALGGPPGGRTPAGQPGVPG